MFFVLAVYAMTAMEPVISSCLEQRLSWYGEPGVFASCGVCPFYVDSRNFPIPFQRCKKKRGKKSHSKLPSILQHDRHSIRVL
ncbi:hypothetical protein CGRA01v4_09549 [Colletotrichum graminicola]|nr:hypothetical protein CGRA01v4_09549 [Colletotrichum graminicola]